MKIKIDTWTRGYLTGWLIGTMTSIAGGIIFDIFLKRS